MLHFLSALHPHISLSTFSSTSEITLLFTINSLQPDLAILTELIQPYERLQTLIALKGMSKPSFSYMLGLLIEKRISYVR